MTRFRVNSNRLALLILVYYVVLALLNSAASPPFEPPDEAAHFLYTSNIATSGALPVLETRRVVMDSMSVERHQLPLYYMLGAPLINWTDRSVQLMSGALPVLETRRVVMDSMSVERHQLPLYYMLGAPLINWTDRSDADHYLRLNPLASIGVVNDNNVNVHLHPIEPGGGQTVLAVWILRLFSMALGVITLWFVYRTGETAFPGRRVGLLAMTLVVSMPTFVFVSAGINNDNLVTVLYAAGIYMTARLWRNRAITLHDALLLAVILGMISIAKLHGITLFGVVYFWALIGLWRGRFTRREIVMLVGVTLAGAALLAGWNYVRNYQLYGDFFAVDASLQVWSRGTALPSSIQHALIEAKGVWESMWMILGHLNIRGPVWVFTYIYAITAIAVVGIVVAFWRKPQWRGSMLMLLMVFIGIAAALAFITRRMNVSQGRFMFPSLVAFAPLMALGWQTILGRRLSALLIAPLALAALISPVLILPRAYGTLERVAEVPIGARVVNVQAEGLAVLGYELYTDRVAPDDLVRLDLYIRGENDANPVLFVMAVNPISKDPISGIDTYPGMSPTDSLDPNAIYRVPIQFRMNENAVGIGPYALEIAVGWRDPETDRHLHWTDMDGNPLTAVLLTGPLLIDPNHAAPAPEYPTDVTFGEAIRLAGYTLSDSELAAGDELAVTLNWRYLAPLTEDYTVTLALTDADGNIITQDDGMPAGYPTSRWRPGPDFSETRTLTIPEDTPAGEYKLYVGWYRASDGTRLQVSGGNIRDNLLILPVQILVYSEEMWEQAHVSESDE